MHPEFYTPAHASAAAVDQTIVPQTTYAPRQSSGTRERTRELVEVSPIPRTDEELIQRITKMLPGPGERPMRVFRSDSFVVVSECDDVWTRERLWLFDRTYHQFRAFARKLDVPLSAPAEPLVCVLVTDEDRYTAFTRASGDKVASWASGYYATKSNWVVMYDERTSNDVKEALREIDQHEASTQQKINQARRSGRLDEAKARQALQHIDDERKRIKQLAEDNAVKKAIHECVHLLAFNTGLQPKDRTPPVWLSEGLATSFETIQPRSAFGPGLGQKTIAQKRSSVPMGKAVTLTDPNHIPTADVDAFYTMSADLFEQLYRTRRPQMRAYFLDIASLPPGTSSEVALRTLFEKHFGSVDVLARQLGW
ncbi:MAG: DUF1570 domain-containing protein [Phycisphaeraceae bacterium]|nr:DUF1570 domain-containing protein [Phycisphaerales bacterium]MCB9860714.1 DUF1570 domain-containing protein [Phycisphaeraceae bacterium]